MFAINCQIFLKQAVKQILIKTSEINIEFGKNFVVQNLRLLTTLKNY